MRSVTDLELLDIWQQAVARDPVDYAVTLLAVACPEQSMDELRALSIGQRDARLLTLREQLFGRELAGLAACPRCGQRLELAFDVDELRVPEADHAKEHTLRVQECEVTFRLPNSEDLAVAARHGDAAEARALLLSLCITAVRQDEESIPPTGLPATVLDAVVERMAEVDSQAIVQVALSCPSCRYTWGEVFDIASFLWDEVGAWTRRVLREVHALASAYGWREPEVLAMSPVRRRMYMELIGT